MKALLVVLLVFTMFGLVSAVSINNPNLPLVQTTPTTTTTSAVNYSLVNVNNSQFLQSLNPQQVANLQTDRYNSTYALSIPWAYNQTTPAINYCQANFVPYTGATSNINIGIYNLTTNKLNFNQNTSYGIVQNGSDLIFGFIENL